MWDLASGKTVRTIRGECGPGNAGKILRHGLSHDGKLLAVGGWLGSYKGLLTAPDEEVATIRLYDFASGKFVALLKGHDDVVLGLAFSPDGSNLISGSGDNDRHHLGFTGITVLRSAVAQPKFCHRLRALGLHLTPSL